MMLTDILIASAVRIGAPLVKAALESYVGGTGAAIGGQVIDTIAREAGVAPEALPALPADKLDQAVARVEADPTPALVLAYVDGQREANRLMLAEMAKEPVFGWAWRPAGMWGILFLWLWALVMVPIVNAVVGSAVEAPPMDPLIWLTTTYFALYMGGHTLKEVAADFTPKKS